MKLSTYTFLLVSLAASSLAGCSGDDGAIAVDAATTPLTPQANDALFTVRITDARADGYSLQGLVVKAIPEGKAAITVTCTPADKNTNSKLDKDESLACTEGTTNTLDASLSGKEIVVEVYAQIDGAETRIGDAKWVAK